MRHWNQHSFGYLPDGSRVMLAVVCANYSSRRMFPAILICQPGGLYRLWRDGTMRLLASGYEWPEATEARYRAESSLNDHVPKLWGIQYYSAAGIALIPTRILKATTSNFGRLLIAWFHSERAAC